MLLDFGHCHLLPLDLSAEIVHINTGEERAKHCFALFPDGISKFDMNICASWSDKSFVQFLAMIRGHKNEGTFLGRGTVNGVEKSAETEFIARVPGLLALLKSGVNIFQQKKAALWYSRQQREQGIVRHLRA